MSLRGRVIRRQPVSCYNRPQSIQEQKQKCVDLIDLFDVPIYRSYTLQSYNGVAALQEVGLIGKFPFPDILPSDVSAFLPADNPVWLSVFGNCCYTACCKLSVPPLVGAVKRVIIVVNMDGETPTVHSSTWLTSAQPGTDPLSGGPMPLNNNELLSNESICMINPTRYAVSTTSSGYVGCDRLLLDLPSPTARVYCALFSTLKAYVVDEVKDYLSYTTTVSPSYYFQTRFT